MMAMDTVTAVVDRGNPLKEVALVRPDLQADYLPPESS
jgi:hypothetical protein